MHGRREETFLKFTAAKVGYLLGLVIYSHDCLPRFHRSCDTSMRTVNVLTWCVSMRAKGIGWEPVLNIYIEKHCGRYKHNVAEASWVKAPSASQPE